MPIRAVIFDLDGTLFDSLEDLAEATNRMLMEKGLPRHPVSAYRTFVGSGARELIRKALPESMRSEMFITDCVMAFKTAYAQTWNLSSRLYEGIAELLDALQKTRLSMAILSNKPHAFTEKCIHAYFSRWTFHPVLGQTDRIPRKPDPAGAFEIAGVWGLKPADIAFVGDSAIDMQTAVQARMIPIGVSWGFRPVDELQSHGAACILEKPGDLLELLEIRNNA